MPDEEPREDFHEPVASTDGALPTDEVGGAIVGRFPDAVYHDSHGQPVVYVSRDSWHDVAVFLRDEERFTQCLDVTVVDHLVDQQRLRVPGVEPARFEVVANFLSHPRNRRVRTICEVSAEDPKIASLVDVFPGVNFGEREAYDLYGVVFGGHPDLTRILMPDDWVGYPLRKDDAPGRVPVAFKGDPSPR
jgi:NADH:ubiquinone oxidoreductase subunit C